jgi:hypothetical protein
MSRGAAVVDLAEYRARRARQALEVREHAARHAAMAPMPLVMPYVCTWIPCAVWLQPWYAM